VSGLARERHKHLSAPPEPQRPGRDPDELDQEAARLRTEEAALSERLAAAREQLAAAVAGRSTAEAALSETERRLAANARAAAQRAERVAQLRSQVGAAQSRLTAAQEEAGRLATAFAQARARAQRAQHEYGELQDLVSGRDEGRADFAVAHEQAAAALTRASARVTDLRTADHQASGARAALRARSEALHEAVRRGADASGALLAEPGRFGGVLGSLASLLTVEDGAADAIAAALGAVAGAVAVAGLDTAVDILAVLKREDAGRADLVIAADRPPSGSRAPGPGGTGQGRQMGAGLSVTRALDLVKAPGELAQAVERLLDGVFVAEDLTEGLAAVRADPELRIVTRDGDLIGAHWARGGSAGAPSLLGLRAAAQEAEGALGEAENRCQRAERDLADAIDDEQAARRALAEAQAVLQEADAAAAETSGRLGTLAGAAKAARDEAGRLGAAIEAAERAREQDLAKLADVQARLAKQEAEPQTPDGRETDAEKRALAESAVAARSVEMDGRLEVRTVEERLRAIAGRGDALAAAAVAERQAIARAAARRERAAQEAAVASAVATAAAITLERIEQSRSVADEQRQAAELASKERGTELAAIRIRIREFSDELDNVVDSAHGAEIARASQQLRLDQIAGRAAEEFGANPDTLIAEYGPQLPVPGPEEDSLPAPYDRAVQERRAQQAQRLLDQLGKVNPLALEEFAALEERHAFLVTQLEDLRKTRRDLLTVIKEVDDRVQQVFAAAFEDTAREFERIIGRLFPGGDGRLLLTEPDDMLATGIEVEARPPGKKVKRLSLLSGGERALTAIAFLVAIFKARPSPFYVLDEVEAALDDVNLQRLLEIFEELRESSQLIIVTHQKRTMEVADSLYGVSMRGDGVSAVISQRLRERESA
jgi:chromosome segregation protein